MPLYHAVAEIYLLVGTFTAPILCILGWLLLGKIISKRLRSYAWWYLPSIIGSSLSASTYLLTALLRYFHSRNYALGTAVYFLNLAAVPFYIVSFVRFWKTITGLPPGTGEQPPFNSTEQDESVWPPQPRR
jgi:hypothetical protein